MEVIGYAASVLMGLSLGLIGGGGSILTVPILVYLFRLSPQQATGYSLFIVGLTALVGAFAFIKRKEVDFKTGLVFAVPSFFGVYLSRAYIVPGLPQEIAKFGEFTVTKDLLIMAAFAVLMVLASYSMIVGNKTFKPKEGLSDTLRYSIVGVEGLVVGGITGFVGAGGGFLIIPALVILAGLPMKRAVGTSLMIIAIKSLFGFIGDVQKAEHVEWGFLLTLSAIAVVGILLGSNLGKFVHEQKLKKGFGWFVLIMGSAILVEQISKHF